MSEEIDEALKAIGRAEYRLNQVAPKYHAAVKYLAECKRRHKELVEGRYYVYIVFVEGEVKYIGKGTKERWKHALGGASTVALLNRDFFEGKKIEVRCFRDFIQEKEALEIEKDLIGIFGYQTQPPRIYNKDLPEPNDFRYVDWDDEGIYRWTKRFDE